MNIQKQQYGFTLIELVVAIAILAILATVGFMGYSSYLPAARDTNRISQLEELSKGIQTYTTRHSNLPIPDNQIELKANGNVIAYQGEGGQNLLDTIGYNQEGVDPKDKLPFSYLVSSNRKAYQLMAMLETRENLNTTFSLINKATAVDYKKRFPKVFGNHLGILTNTDNVPIQDIISVQSAGFLDVVTTPDTYVAHISDLETEKITGNGAVLSPIALSLINGKNYKSCKSLYRGEPLSHNKDDYYYIKPEGYSKFKIYCDMTTDGGGWTRYVAIKGNYTYKDARYCVDNLKRVDNDNLFCFYPRALGKLKDYLYINKETGTKYQLSGLDQPYNEISGYTPVYRSKYKHTLFDFIIYKSDPTINWARFGIAFMHKHPESHGGFEPGGMATYDSYMNYDDQGKSGPSGSNREADANRGEFYVR